MDYNEYIKMTPKGRENNKFVILKYVYDMNVIIYLINFNFISKYTINNN